MLRALLIALVGCAGAEATTLQQPAAPAKVVPSETVGLNPGENMAFEVHLAGVLAGQAQLAVGEIGETDGHRAVVVKSRAETAGAAALVKHLVDEATTTIDMGTGRPLALDTLVENGAKRITATATFVGSVATITYQRSDDKSPTPRTTKINFGKVAVHDAHSAMAQLRGWKGTKGEMRTVYVVGGRRLWRIDLTYVGESTIGSALGNRRVVQYDGKSYRARGDLTIEGNKPARSFSVWLTDDADRVPLKVVAATELGDIVMDLTEYNR